MTPRKLTQALQSRGTAIAAALLLAGGALWAFLSGDLQPIAGSQGLAFPSPNLWFPDPEISLWVNVGAIIIMAVIMVVVNGQFNFIRSLSIGYATLFLFMELSVPDDLAQFNGGVLMLAGVLVGMSLLFSAFANPLATRRIFLLFLILSSGVTVYYGFLFLIPLFLLGMLQMRVLKWRPVLAAAMGIITPWWILIGLGLINPLDLSWPVFTGVFTGFDPEEAIHGVVIAAVTGFLSIAAWVMNFTKLITYNAKTRAMNGFVALGALAAMAMMALDYSDFPSYMALLNCFTAYQIGHYIAIRQPDNGYIFSLTVMVVYVSFYLWRVII